VAAKSGVIGLTKTWARELGPSGIRVNAVAPGFIQTDMIATVPDKVIESMKERTPLRRIGQAEDIANAYLFLASDEASFITGTVLSVDGGLMF
jgi:3-oxoacyl-[acyl-carrier protein] reductase